MKAVKNGILLQKLHVIEESLQQLRSLGEVSVAELQEDWRTRRAVERVLQVCVEAMIDICQRILVLEQVTPATSGGEAVRRCVQLQVLSSEEPYRRMVQFRNFIVHRYEQIEVEILAGILNRHLGDFAQFVQEIKNYLACS